MTEGGADFPLVTMSTVFQPSTLLSYHLPRTSYRYTVNLVVQHFQLSQILHQERVLDIPSIWCCNVIYLQNTRLLHDTSTTCRQSGVNTFTHLHYSRTSFYGRQSELSNALSLILFSIRVSSTPSIRIIHHCYWHLQCPKWHQLQRLRALKGHLYFIISWYLFILSTQCSCNDSCYDSCFMLCTIRVAT